MPPKSHKTSDSDFEIFKSSVIYWMSFFGLKSWECGFEHNDKHIENRATCVAELGARHVTFVLTKSRWTYAPTESEIRLMGFHEVAELLLMRLQTYASERHPIGDLNDIVHEIIHTLENSIYRLVEIEKAKKSQTLDTQSKTS